MSIAERFRPSLPTQATKQWVLGLPRKAMQSVQQFAGRHGFTGTLLAIMVVASGIRLLWSSDFPILWWVFMLIALTGEFVKDRFVWPRERYLHAREDDARERAEAARKEQTNAGGDA